METIIVQPKSSSEYKAVLDVFKKMKVKTKLYKEPAKAEILNLVEKDAKEAASYLKGKTKLKDAKKFLNEL
jgi:excinuclease UvrABC nuclease subunit